MPRCLVSIGSNVGDSAQVVEAAFKAIRSLPGVDDRDFAASRVIVTQPVGGPSGQPPVYNAVVAFRTADEPRPLLDALRAIEAQHGRVRRTRWAERTLDLDLLLHGDAVIGTDTLRVPHPRMTFRPFVLTPAVEVAAEWLHPEAGVSLAEIDRVLRQGSNEVRVVGDAAEQVASWVATHSPTVMCRPGAPDGGSKLPRLTINTAPEPRAVAGPRLALADCAAEHWQDEVAAALRCVWPDA